MKFSIKYLIICLPFLLSLISCEDPIDLDLGPPKVQLVIDALINNSTDTQYIYISKTTAYNDNRIAPGFKIDSVGILDPTSFTYYDFTYKGNGVYYFVPPSSNLFVVDQDYQLIARDGANTYVSQSRLNSATTIDSVTYKFEPEGSFGGSEGNYITLWAKDKVGVGDYYWLRLFRNDSIQARASDLNIAIDNAYSEGGSGDGNLFIVPIREAFNSRPWKPGEKAVIEILSVPPEMFFYVNLARTQLQNVGLFAVPPSNVPCNIICANDPNIKVVGFFSMAGIVKSETIIIK